MHYLLKTEPTAYSFADLVKEKETDWTGVTNPHSGEEPQGHEERRQAGHLSHWRRKGGSGSGSRHVGGFIRSQGSAGSHCRWCCDQAAKNAGGNQATEAISRISPGAPVTAFRSAARRGPVRLDRARLKTSVFSPSLVLPDEGRVPHISLVFREMWDTTGPPL